MSMHVVYKAGLMMLVVFIAFAAYLPQHVHAGWFDRIRDVFTLPEKVDTLKEQYEDAREQMNLARAETLLLIEEMEKKSKALEDSLTNTERSLQETKDTLESYKVSQQRLVEENEQLLSQNTALQQQVDTLRLSEQKRTTRYRRIMSVIATAAGFILLYFILARVMRIVLRSR